MVQKVTKDNFEELTQEGKVVLLDFYADWCGPCRMVSPIVEQIAQEYPQIVVGKINVDEQPMLSAQFGVMSIPTLVVMKDGEAVETMVGARSKASILKMLSLNPAST